MSQLPDTENIPVSTDWTEIAQAPINNITIEATDKDLFYRVSEDVPTTPLGHIVKVGVVGTQIVLNDASKLYVRSVRGNSILLATGE